LTGDDGIAPAFYATPDAWRAWLEAHHGDAREHWVGFHKRDSGRESITWPEAVDQALCFGWIDGIRRRIDDASYMIRFTPRKRTSRWSIAAFEARTVEGRYSYEQRDAAAFDPERERRLRADAAAWEYFSRQAPWYRRTATHWVMSAKREETRDRRLARLIADCAAGRPTGPLARP
jgi:uncharacterized protein YdeI (YjbR/CyaY-like superfamily)